MNRSLMALAALLLPTTLTAQVQDAPVGQAQLAKARDLVTKLHIEDRLAARLDTLMNAGKPDEDCLSKDESRTDVEQYRHCEAQAERDRGLFEPIRRKHLPAARARLLEAAALAYARLLSPDDLNVLIAFYDTSAGQRVAEAGRALDRAFADAVAKVEEQLMVDVLGDAQKELSK